jgi:tetratricopeptide (TPR) repeat protein
MKIILLLLISSTIVLNAYSQINNSKVTGITSYDNAVRYYNEGNYQKAIFYYNEYLQLYPNDSKRYSERGLTYENLNQFDMAERDYSQAITLSPFSSEYFIYRGYARMKMGDADRAVSDFTQAILYGSQKVDQKKSEGYTGRMEAYLVLGNYDLAYSDANSAINSDVTNPFLLINKGIVCFYLEDTVQIFNIIDTLLKINPYDLYKYVKSQNRLFGLKKFLNTVDRLSVLIKDNPEIGVLYFRRGFNYYVLRKYDLAKSDFETCLKFLPEQEITIRNFSKRFIEVCSKY